MKTTWALCCLTVLLGCSTPDAPTATKPPEGQIGTDRLAEAFSTYVQKAEDVTLDAAQREQMRQELEAAKADPLLRPYPLEGGRIDRPALMRQIAAGLEKWRASGMPLSKSTRYASKRENLEALSDAELVMASRLVEQRARAAEARN